MFPTFFAANAVSVCLLQHCHPGQARQYTTGEIFGEQAAKKTQQLCGKLLWFNYFEVP